MAITTVDGAIAGLRRPERIAKPASANAGSSGTFISTWSLGGMPNAGAFDTTLNGVALTAPITGQIPYTNPAAGSGYLGRLQVSNIGTGIAVLCDRLWHNGGYTITSAVAQNSTTPAWPARDVVGSINGDGVLLGLEVSAATGAGTPTITISYTNSAGTAGKTGVNIQPTTASSTAGKFYPISLQSGDKGVRSVQSLTLSATWTSGTINLVAYRPLAYVDVKTGFKTGVVDAITGCMPVMYNSSVPWLMFINGGVTNAVTLNGNVHYTQG